ncbi:hypothetical protein JZ751_026177 [Albula glossodonta]|uniref:Uncharacterized protein n=1 Tax=Albula glossodonta TaxID=121402 RepID=A0A8T2PB72_9TELE|nr:hypothetical protein JZ751_026177 [Albula glossodonta]
MVEEEVGAVLLLRGACTEKERERTYVSEEERKPEDLSREIIQIQQREIGLKQQNYSVTSRNPRDMNDCLKSDLPYLLTAGSGLLNRGTQVFDGKC